MALCDTIGSGAPVKPYGKSLRLLGVASLMGVTAVVAVNLHEAPSAGVPQHRAAPVVSVAVACAAPTHITRVYFGTVRAARQVDLAFAVAGTIAKTHPDLDPGAQLAQGAPLAALDKAPFRLAVRAAEAAVERAKRALTELEVQRETEAVEVRLREELFDLAERGFARTETLVGRGVATEVAREERTRARAMARAALSAATQAVAATKAKMETKRAIIAELTIAREEAQFRLGKSELAAPFDAIVASVEGSVGEETGPQIPFASLYDPHRLEAHFVVPFSDLSPDDFDGAVTLTVRRRHGAEDKAHAATLVRQMMSVDGAGGATFVAAIAPDDSVHLRPGDFVTVHLVRPIEVAHVLVPATALQEGAILRATPVSRGEAWALTPVPATIVDVVADGLLLDTAITPGDKMVVSPLRDAGQVTRAHIREAPSRCPP